MKKVKTAIFPVGGLGTRFLPATKSMPKEMLPVANKPIIQHAFEEAKHAGIENFIFITGRNKDAINNHFDFSYELESKLDIDNKIEEIDKVSSWLPEAGKIAFIRQQKPLGLGHAIWCARNFIQDDEPFAVILADELIMNQSNDNFLSKMIEKYYDKGSRSPIIGVDTVPDDQINKYGIVLSQDDQVLDMVEKPKIGSVKSNTAIVGRYILNPQIFKYLQKMKIGAGNEIQLTDSMKDMMGEEKFYLQILDSPRFDCGNVLGYIEANLAFSLNDDTISDKVQKILTKYIK
jgi:UTP-glucose-1-phosphate uridylyltransferase